MANHKSAEKRNRQAQASRLRNRANKSVMKNAVRSFREVIVEGTVEESREALRKATSVIATTARKGTIPKKTASRKVSRLAKMLKAKEAPVEVAA
ncbi:30S ribosomal protein S20 [Desulforhopalus vacuolatus]|uniref:30S ribosomal protein S20 n=1 Tax=Desulforhopalus vacuolatus TaxID=40414 RepID=UPI001963D1AC|nr:30S ribosomal protein S20 [Desulforhopalus vacuolatus]